MKRYVAILVCIVLLVTLGACGKDGEQQSAKEVGESIKSEEILEAANESKDKTTDENQVPNNEPNIKPSIVLYGDTSLINLCLPNLLPNKKAKVSVVIVINNKYNILYKPMFLITENALKAVDKNNIAPKI